MLIALTALGALLLWLASRTRWDLGAPLRLRRRRPWGSLITSGWHLYCSRPRLFLGIGLVFVPLSLLIAAIQYVVFRIAGLDALVDSVGASNAFVAALAFALGAAFTVLGLALVQAVTALAMVELDEGRPIRAWPAYQLALRQLRPLARALVRAVLVVAVLDLSVVGIPVAAGLSCAGRSPRRSSCSRRVRRHALRRSGLIVQGHWWRVASVVFVSGAALLLGPVVGTLMLLLTSASFNLVNLVAGLVYVVAIPFAAIITTYLYYDCACAEKLAPAEAVPAVLPAEL